MDEWLPQGERAVGQSSRVIHKCGNTAAMSIRNTPDAWLARCHRCHEGGRVKRPTSSCHRSLISNGSCPGQRMPSCSHCGQNGRRSRYQLNAGPA